MVNKEGTSFSGAPMELPSRTASSTVQVEQRASSLSHSINAHNQFFVWREFLWGGIAGAVGEGMMHPVDTLKTRIQSQAILSSTQRSDTSLTGSLATGATYFGFIESTKSWLEESHPSLGGHWAHFLAGGVGDALGSFVYVPCEVMKQRMQVQGTSTSWSSVIGNANSSKIPGVHMYKYYTGVFHAGSSIWKEQGFKGLYAGYWSTLARDVPFAGLMVMFYESLKETTEYGMKRWAPNSDYHLNSSMEGLLLGGVSGGLSAYITTPLDVIKTRLQVQGPSLRYNGWLDAIRRTWMIEGTKGFFKGSVPRIMWYVPASALTFMSVEFLRDNFNKETS